MVRRMMAVMKVSFSKQDSFHSLQRTDDFDEYDWNPFSFTLTVLSYLYILFSLNHYLRMSIFCGGPRAWLAYLPTSLFYDPLYYAIPMALCIAHVL
ncbi:uncharacterized protein F5147DRAFT_694136 [Suillus discolor]|uniref:Uncharacterized protein n=1 Tax=Suillus discolor TaxID=1912936 RepID=A0A9P7F8D6_9AGAM|nr:uncharacterized protein F5147DRAFT_694136 [Suillus discolor]KAG2108647.1 hypothetical protein F5147DRAFT_694136 [Suillus discolor]